jgi:hypothetical protein
MLKDPIHVNHSIRSLIPVLPRVDLSRTAVDFPDPLSPDLASPRKKSRGFLDLLPGL